MRHFATVEEYLASFDGMTKQRLTAVRELIQQQLPTATERISYNMPAYFIDKKLIVYFAGFAHHIGMYPGRTNSAAYNQLAAKYAYGKSTARFPHSEPLPEKIIQKFIQTRLQEVQAN